MLQCAIEQMQVKEARRREEEKLENEFKKKLIEKFAEDERLEQYNAIKRKQKELDYKKEVKFCLIQIERQWQEKLRQYQLQREQELNELETLRREEMSKRELIEREKERLIRENEDILKSFYSKGYFKTVSGNTK